MPDLADSAIDMRGEPFYPDVDSGEAITENQYEAIQALEWTSGMPMPMYWRILVAPTRPPTRSKGGILIPEQSQDAHDYLNHIGKILALGPLVGVHRRLEHPDATVNATMRRPEVGDWVSFARFATLRYNYRGIRLLLVDEEALLAYLDEGPEGYKIFT